MGNNGNSDETLYFGAPKSLQMVTAAMKLKDTGTPLQYSCLENPMDGEAWKAVVHGVATSWTRLSDFTFTFHFHALEKEMATHSRTLAWRIPGTGEPGGLPSLGLHRVGHNWSDLAAAAAAVNSTGEDCLNADRGTGGETQRCKGYKLGQRNWLTERCSSRMR